MREVGVLRGRSREVADPGDLLALARDRCDDSPLVYWEHPAGGRAMLAIGVVREVRARGRERFAAAAEGAARVLATAATDVGEASHLRVLGGFGFSDLPRPAAADRDYPPVRIVLPRVLWIREGGQTRLTEIWDEGDAPTSAAATRSTPGVADAASALRLSVPAPSADERADWRVRVGRAQALIDDGSASKIVLARRRRLVADRPIDPAAMLMRARAARPGCFNVWVRPPSGPSLIASTPELLVRRAGSDVTASALAGSAPRSADGDEDDRLAAALRACPKNTREHALVVAAVRAALDAVGADVEPPLPPEILRLPEVQHLATPIRARLRRSLPVFALGGALHPTPAVCGVPGAVARALIEREEPDRGWYTRPLRWMDARGDGELVVTLRSALVAGRELTLWAGAGIVDGSDADAELAETEAKMRALVAPFLAPAAAAARPPLRAREAAAPWA